MMRGSAVLLVTTCAVGLAQSRWSVTEIPGMKDVTFLRIGFVDDRIGWLADGRSRIALTLDGGHTWREVNAPSSISHFDVAGLWFADEKRGWATGDVDGHPTIWETVDGGDSWTVALSWPRVYEDSTGALLDICFVDASRGWAVGFNGFNSIVLATNDGGHHWETQYSGSEIDGQFNEVQCEDALNCWVLGPNAVMQTEDGESWRLVYFDHSTLGNLDVISHSNVWGAAGWDHILHGTRGGVRWTEVPLKADDFSEYVKFADAKTGWVVLNKERIKMTRDGGKTWTREATPALHGLTPCAMAATSTTLFVIANPGHLLERPLH